MTGDYEGLQRVTWGDKRLQRVTMGDRGLRKVTESYLGLGLGLGTRDYRG